MLYPATSATVETLPNGLALILDPDPAAPVVSVQIWVETGSMHEDAHLGSGLSHFLEHMVFKGTRDFGGDELAAVVQGAGGHWNAYTSFDRTVYYIDGPNQSLATFLKTLTGLVFFPTLPEEDFEREKDVIRREIDMGLDDPDNVASRLLFSTVFQADPRRHPVIGHRHLFDAIRYGDLREYHRARYAPDRCFCVISGDFDADFARKEIVELTADCRHGAGREPLVAIDHPQLGPRAARETFAVPASRISLAWKMPALDHPDTPAFDAFAAMLGRGRASRLHRVLREERELALEISAFSWAGPGREGLFAVSAEALPEKRDPLITGILEEISGFAAGEIDAELARAKRQIASSQFRSLTTASGRAADLGSNWHEARDLDFTSRYLAAIDAVTPDAIRRVAATLTGSRLTRTILDPTDAPAPARSQKRMARREEIEVRTLANGLTIALVPDRRVPLVHLQAAVRGGMPSERPRTNGINQLLAATLPKGSTRRGAREIAETLESLGASIGASAGNNALLIQAAGLAPDLATIAEIFGEIVTSPALAADSVAREKASQLASLEENLQDPLHRAFRELRREIFAGEAYGLDPLGSLESLAALDAAAVADHHGRFFNASNVTVAIAGDFDSKYAADLIERHFAAMRAGTRIESEPGKMLPGGDKTIHLPKKQAVLTIGFSGASVTGTDRHALAMIQEYASDMAGPLFTRIREELGLAYQVGATQFLGFRTGLFTFYLATSPEQADLARSEILAEISKIATQGIPDESLERVRSTVLSGLAIQQQSPSSTARHVALDLLFGHPPDEYRRLASIYRSIDRNQISEVAARIFATPPTIVTVNPAP